jgi:hypothetical protein
MGVYTASNGASTQAVTPDHLLDPANKWSKYAPLFAKAREAVESGKAVAGVWYEV